MVSVLETIFGILSFCIGVQLNSNPYVTKKRVYRMQWVQVKTQLVLHIQIVSKLGIFFSEIIICMPADTKARRCLLKVHVLFYINPSEACYQVLNQTFVLLGLVLLRS